MTLSGKTAVITGSSRGIGRAIAMALSAAGANVVLNASKSERELAETLSAILSSGGNAISVLADVSTYDGAKALFCRAEEAFGSVDILVNNAGISQIGLFGDMTPCDWQRLMAADVESVFNCTHLALPHMIHQKSGVILNISSIWGVTGASCEAVYSAAKGAVNAFTKAMAKELAPSGIRVNAIACGVIQTGMNAFLSDTETKELAEEIPLGRFGTPEEVAKVAKFLVSEESSYLTGQILTLDGGFIG